MRRNVIQLRRNRLGLGMVEAMISLAIAASLLTAVAMAFRASADAVEENDKFFRATQAARVAMARILTQVRRGTPATDSTSSNLHLLTDNGLDVSYNYNSGTQRLSLVTSTQTILVHDATSCTFSYQLGTDPGGLPCVSKATVTIAVAVGNNSILLTGSASPRRTLTF
jgi:type II secretory pathway pseudopilin PulG